nr:hypothetical protein CFP56_38591 [Quercus suber]
MINVYAAVQEVAIHLPSETSTDASALDKRLLTTELADQVKAEILFILQFREGKLLNKYVGAPNLRVATAKLALDDLTKRKETFI